MMSATSFSRWIAAFVLAFAASAHAAEPAALRPKVAKPLQAAQAAVQAKNYQLALDKLGEAQKVGDLSPYETYTVDRLHAVAALGLGDQATALQALSAAAASSALPEADKQPVLETLARLAYANKNYAKATQVIGAYRDAGGRNAEVLNLLPQAWYLAGDYAAARKELLALFAQMQASGQTPSEMQLKLYLSCAIKQNDMTARQDALERLVRSYPQADYWQDLIAVTAGQAGFADRLTLDLYRLKKATSTMDNAAEYAEAAQLALTAGFPGEAKRYVDDGYAKKLLGQGANAGRDQQLKALVDKKLAEDRRTLAEGEKAAAAQASGEALVATGLNYAGYGEYDKGVSLIQQGIAKGKLKRPDDAQLHLGYVQLMAGQDETARQTFAGVNGKDGAAAIAHLWLLVRQPQ